MSLVASRHADAARSGSRVSGAFRRRVLIGVGRSATATGEVRVALEDDYHHLRVTVGFDRGIVSRTAAVFPRRPFTTCAAAVPELAVIEGRPLSTVASEVNRWTDARLQCTHMLDMAGLGIAAAARGDQAVRYDVEVPDRRAGVSSATLARDGAVTLAWTVDDITVLAPEPFVGQHLGRGFAGWALGALGAIEAEAAMVLRRAVVISRGRAYDQDSRTHAEPLGRCFSQQPDRAEAALRVVGSTLDFSERAEALCADDFAWIAERTA